MASFVRTDEVGVCGLAKGRFLTVQCAGEGEPSLIAQFLMALRRWPRAGEDRAEARCHYARCHYGHPITKALMKHTKSLPVRMGDTVEPSQFAYVSPAMYRLMKQMKSLPVRMVAPVEPSQLG